MAINYDSILTLGKAGIAVIYYGIFITLALRANVLIQKLR
jgi:hypothetical protein